jgi:hypothetical protein
VARTISIRVGTIPPPSGFPDGTNRPHMISGTVMAYTDGAGTAQTVTLSPLPSPGSTFGVNATTGVPNNGATYDARGWVDITVDNTKIDGYDFNAVGVGNVAANNAVISRCWFRNQDGQNSYVIWPHDHGPLSGLLIEDCLAHGTTGTGTGFISQMLHMDGQISNVIVRRCHVFNAGGFVQFAPIVGTGTKPYGNQVVDNYTEIMGGEAAFGWHLEQINVSSGTGGLLIAGNHFTGPTGQTATIYLCHDSGDVGKIAIDNNLLDGLPQNTIYAGDTGATPGVLISTAGNIEITNNKFADGSGQNPGGLVITPAPGDPRLVVSGNVRYPSLTPIPGM